VGQRHSYLGRGRVPPQLLESTTIGGGGACDGERVDGGRKADTAA